MRPLLVLLERLWDPLGASSTALGASWGALGRVLGALRELLGTPTAQDKSLLPRNERLASVGARFPKPVLANEREARAVRNHEDIRR